MRLDDLFSTDSFLSDSQMLDTLSKALTAGYGGADAPATRTQGGALQTESLDQTLRAVTWEYKHLKTWPMIPKEKAWNLVEQYNRQTGYGQQGEGGFFDGESGSLPPSGDGTFVREVQKVRFIGTTRSVSHPATLVRTAHAPMMALQIEAGTRKILEDMERQLWIANSYFVDPATGNNTGDVTHLPVDAVNLKFNGLDQQIRFGQLDTNAQYSGFDGFNNSFVPVMNMAPDGIASVPDEDDLTELAYRQSVNFGVPTDFFCSLKTAADISRQLLPKEWITPPGQEGRGGFVLTSFIAASGTFSIVGTRFLEPRRGPLAAPTGQAPNVPVIGATGTEADATSKLLAGTYYYRVSAVGQFGESLAAAEVSQAVAAGNRITITISAGTVGAIAYAVFRSSVFGSGWEFIGMVKDSTGNGGGAVFRDAGRYLPGLAHAYLTEFNPMNVIWRQLAPLLKLDLAVISPAYRWMQLLYGTPIIYAPLHHQIMDNIGRA